MNFRGSSILTPIQTGYNLLHIHCSQKTVWMTQKKCDWHKTIHRSILDHRDCTFRNVTMRLDDQSFEYVHMVTMNHPAQMTRRRCTQRILEFRKCIAEKCGHCTLHACTRVDYTHLIIHINRQNIKHIIWQLNIQRYLQQQKNDLCIYSTKKKMIKLFKKKKYSTIFKFIYSLL